MTRTRFNRHFAGLLLLLGGLACFALPRAADAATMNLVGNTSVIAVGDEFVVDIQLDSEEEGINSAQATLRYPHEFVSVTKIDKGGSLFNFWLLDPVFDNSAGTLRFIGGSSDGFSGKSLQILRVTFKTRGAGKVNLTFDDAAVTASDGSGANVLTQTRGLTIDGGVGSGSATTTFVPTQIKLPPVVAQKLPNKPEPVIELYPDAEVWYNTRSSFGVHWPLPNDTRGVAATVDRNPDGAPTASQGVFDNFSFPPLDDGVWYLHIRFKNSVGWGPTATRRIALDTTPPSPFEIDGDFKKISDDPTPEFQFTTRDQLSGVAGYSIQVDDQPRTDAATNSYMTAALAPGEHRIQIFAVDRAGNATSAAVDLTILPLASPTINPLPKDVFTNEPPLEVSGTGEPGTVLTLQMSHGSGKFVGSASTSPDQNGNWTASFSEPLKQGDHMLIVVAHDARGAQSLPVRTDFSVRARPFLTLVGAEISKVWFFLAIIFLLLVGYVVGWYLQKRRKEKRGWNLTIAQRDVNSAFDQIQKELQFTLRHYRNAALGQREAQDILATMSRLEERTTRVKKYILEHIGNIKDRL